MEDKELRKAFEEVTTRNVSAAVGHGNDTRALVRILEARVVSLENLSRQQQATIDQFRTQLAGVQTKLFSGGTA